MGEHLRWVQVALAMLAFNIATWGATAAAATEHIAYYRALVREHRGQCSKADAISLFKDAHRCGCEPFDPETFGGGLRRSILFYEERCIECAEVTDLYAVDHIKNSGNQKIKRDQY